MPQVFVVSALGIGDDEDAYEVVGVHMTRAGAAKHVTHIQDIGEDDLAMTCKIEEFPLEA